MTDFRGPSRRNFLAQCLTGAVAMGAGSVLCAEPEQPTPGAKSTVVVARDPMLRGTGTVVDPRRLGALLDRAMQALFGGGHPAAASLEDAIAAWRRIAGPGDTVSLKVNTLGGRGIATNVDLVTAICVRLQQAGVVERNVDPALQDACRVPVGFAVAGHADDCRRGH